MKIAISLLLGLGITSLSWGQFKMCNGGRGGGSGPQRSGVGRESSSSNREHGSSNHENVGKENIGKVDAKAAHSRVGAQGNTPRTESKPAGDRVPTLRDPGPAKSDMAKLIEKGTAGVDKIRTFGPAKVGIGNSGFQSQAGNPKGETTVNVTVPTK